MTVVKTMRWYSEDERIIGNGGQLLSYVVYILRCADGSFFSGMTTNLQARLKEYNYGNGAKYTRSRLPVELLYQETFDNKAAAISLEWRIKQMAREEIIEMLEKENEV